MRSSLDCCITSTRSNALGHEGARTGPWRPTTRCGATRPPGSTARPGSEALEANLLDLSDRLARGGYRPEPVRRVYIDKADGSKRPLGVPALEDKIVQRASAEVLG